MKGQKRAVLALQDGSVFHGYSFGAAGQAVAEVVFNTAMTGYQEILTDPSYAKQMVVLTYPHIGNTGTNLEDEESRTIFCSGLIIRDLPRVSSNFRDRQALDEYLCERGIVGIAGIDTRRVTRILREKGVQNGCLIAADDPSETDALNAASCFEGLQGMDLAKVVSTRERYHWRQGSWALAGGRLGDISDSDARFHVVVYDFGVKRNILRMLVDQGCLVTVVPAQTPADEVLAMQPDGVLLSNGPGDPEPCDYAIAAIRELLNLGVPILGICLGHQLLGLAAGASTVKMKFGHHGANHPVQNLADGTVMISSQNHGFAIDEDTLPSHVQATYRSLFDGTLQGIKLADSPALGFQGHPEASPGPHDVAPFFERFIHLMEARG